MRVPFLASHSWMLQVFMFFRCTPNILASPVGVVVQLELNGIQLW